VPLALQERPRQQKLAGDVTPPALARPLGKPATKPVPSDGGTGGGEPPRVDDGDGGHGRGDDGPHVPWRTMLAALAVLVAAGAPMIAYGEVRLEKRQAEAVQVVPLASYDEGVGLLARLSLERRSSPDGEARAVLNARISLVTEATWAQFPDRCRMRLAVDVSRAADSVTAGRGPSTVSPAAPGRPPGIRSARVTAAVPRRGAGGG
jgi:hypothetical protein